MHFQSRNETSYEVLKVVEFPVTSVRIIVLPLVQYLVNCCQQEYLKISQDFDISMEYSWGQVLELWSREYFKISQDFYNFIKYSWGQDKTLNCGLRNISGCIHLTRLSWEILKNPCSNTILTFPWARIRIILRFPGIFHQEILWSSQEILWYPGVFSQGILCFFRAWVCYCKLFQLVFIT